MTTFNYARWQEDLKELNNRTFRQVKIVAVPTDGTIAGGTQGTTQFNVNFPGFIPCNCIVVLQTALAGADGRTLKSSSIAKRIFLEFNDNGEKLPLGLIPGSGDPTTYSGTFRSCKVSVPSADANGAVLYIALLLGVAFGSNGTVGGSGGGGYLPPGGGGGA